MAKGRPWRPGRTCRKSTGRPIVTATVPAMASRSGERSTSPRAEAVQSRTRPAADCGRDARAGGPLLRAPPVRVVGPRAGRSSLDAGMARIGRPQAASTQQALVLLVDGLPDQLLAEPILDPLAPPPAVLLPQPGVSQVAADRRRELVGVLHVDQRPG